MKRWSMAITCICFAGAVQQVLISINRPAVRRASMSASKEAVMRKPFLVPLSIAVVLLVLLFGFEVASRPSGMMGGNLAWNGPWSGYGPSMMHGYMMRGYGPPWSPSASGRDVNLSVDAVKARA